MCCRLYGELQQWKPSPNLLYFTLLTLQEHQPVPTAPLTLPSNHLAYTAPSDPSFHRWIPIAALFAVGLISFEHMAADVGEVAAISGGAGGVFGCRLCARRRCTSSPESVSCHSRLISLRRGGKPASPCTRTSSRSRGGRPLVGAVKLMAVNVNMVSAWLRRPTRCARWAIAVIIGTAH